jgi:hypothetical protein
VGVASAAVLDKVVTVGAWLITSVGVTNVAAFDKEVSVIVLSTDKAS